MTLFSQLRALVLLRRVARSLEQLVELKKQERKPSRVKGKLVDIGTVDQVEINRQYVEEHGQYEGV